MIMKNTNTTHLGEIVELQSEIEQLNVYIQKLTDVNTEEANRAIKSLLKWKVFLETKLLYLND